MEDQMDVMVERCCGLDVHQATVVACVLLGAAGGKAQKTVRSFETYSAGLLELRQWLEGLGVTHVGMESTGVYWRPVYAILEEGFDLTVGNAHHIKNVPGRKTDVKDAEWIAQLMRHGLIAKSFVPPKPIRELRDLTRYRRKLVESQASERNRLLKLLETANIKLSTVVTDVFGHSGMLMLRALAAGETDVQAMAEHAKGRMKPKKKALRLALEGRLDDHHRFLLQLQLTRLDTVTQDLSRLDTYIDTKLQPFREEYTRLLGIPGVGPQTAITIIAEIGVDMTVFRDEHHLAAWAGLCPGNHETAGKRLSGRTRKGNKHLKTALVEASLGACRKKGSYLRSKYFKLKARRGAGRAAIALGHKILIGAYKVLSNGVRYIDLGETYLDNLNRQRTGRQLVKRLEALGYRVQLEEVSQMA
jgi:transposase